MILCPLKSEPVTIPFAVFESSGRSRIVAFGSSRMVSRIVS